MRGVENILQFVTLPQSPAETIFRGGVGRVRDAEMERERASELCSVCSVGVIFTAIMIDFVPVPTRTTLPFFISSSQAHTHTPTSLGAVTQVLCKEDTHITHTLCVFSN